MSNRSEGFFAYWQGFTKSGTDPEQSPILQLTPSYISTIALAFAVPDQGSTINTDFLTSKNTKESIIAGSRALQEKGQKVVMSLNGNKDFPWHKLNAIDFARNVKKTVIDDWGLDGVDLDNETVGETPSDNFVNVIKELRNSFGADFLISYPAYIPWRDEYFLPKVKDEISLVNTMAYWNDYGPMIELYSTYAKMVGLEKVGIGVKPGYDRKDQSTPIDAVPKLCKFEPEGGKKAGMMMYSLSIDIPQYTQKERFYWSELIQQNLAV